MFNPFGGEGSRIEEISPQKVKEKIDRGDDFILLDVRTHQEYISPIGHIKGSILLPLQTLWHHVEKITPYKDKEIIVVCRSGNRSAEACRILNEMGFQTKNMTGGMGIWAVLGYDVEH